MKTTATRTLLVCAAGVALAACGDDVTEVTEISGTTLVASMDEPAGDNCADGGTAIMAGIDDNEDGVLDAAEVDSTTYVCTGGATATGTTLLTADEPAGDNCPDGGTSITTGVDADGDGALTGDEITDVTYICASGAAGAMISTVADEPVGDNCEFGGVRLDAGTDADGSGTLEGDEIASTSYACYPSDGGADDLLRTETFVGNASANCPGGYVNNHIGFDADKSGTLEDTEWAFTVVTCNLAPYFVGPTAINVDDCTVDASITVEAMDADGTVDDIAIEIRGNGAASAPTVDGATVTIAGSDTNAGGTVFTATATDNYGATTSQRYTLVFTGTGCLPPETFYGVDQTTCTEIEVDDLAGDDRGSLILTPSYAYYNGDDALVRTNRDLDIDSLEAVVDEYVDTLVSDASTFDLYSLWSSDYEFEAIGDTSGELEDEYGIFDQIVPVDEETLEVGAPIDLERPFIGEGEITFTLDDAEFTFNVNDALIGMRDGRLVTAMEGYDGESDLSYVVYTVYDVTDGSVLASASIDSDDENWDGAEWWRQEVDIGHNPVVIRDDVEYLIYRADGGWYEVNVRTTERRLLSSTFATTCDSYHPAVDFTTLRVYGHAEGGCFGFGPYIEESMYVCDLLLAPNFDGAIDDSGAGDD